jgi:hypothetical protein
MKEHESFLYVDQMSIRHADLEAEFKYAKKQSAQTYI